MAAKLITISELDLFFLSYDEDNADKHYSMLMENAPWSKRIHGVKGWDAVHKAAASQSETKMFITIDADTIVYPEFFDLTLHVPEMFQDKALSWNGVNQINGLVYGNGGIKIWPVDKVLGMKTHEAADEEGKKLDFCWYEWYVQFRNIYSETWPNGSEFQAWRAGFREGVKMLTDRGQRVPIEEIKKRVWHENLQRLYVWCSVGSDREYGGLCIKGAIDGAYNMMHNPDFDPAMISDQDKIKQIWDKVTSSESWNFKRAKVEDGLGMALPFFEASESYFVREVLMKQIRPKQARNPMLPEKELELI